MHNNLQFWQQVKKDYLNDTDNCYLCYASDRFSKVYNYIFYPKIVEAARSFLYEKHTLFLYNDFCIGSSFLFQSVVAPFDRKRQIRLDFLDYMIEKCQNTQQ